MLANASGDIPALSRDRRFLRTIELFSADVFIHDAATENALDSVLSTFQSTFLYLLFFSIFLFCTQIFQSMLL